MGHFPVYYTDVVPSTNLNRSKLNVPEFESFLCKFDIVSLTKTHSDDLDVVSLNKFSYFVENRKLFVGLATLIKKDLEHHYSVIESNGEYVQWFKLSRSLCNLEEDVIFGNVYIPSDNMKYFSQQILDEFYTEVHLFNNNNK